jgi:subtilase family serine protease
VLRALSIAIALILSAVVSPNLVTTSDASGPPSFVHVCSAPARDNASCMAIRADATSQPSASAATPLGYGPAGLQSAYNLVSASAASGAGETVAVVDAYNDPTALSDLCTYRSTFSLPPLKAGCTNSTGTGPTFTKVSQSGSTTIFPFNNSNWAQEISLDVDMVSAICPNCNILLVEANSSSLSNLAAAVNRAATMGVVAISNSYGGRETSTETSYDADYNHPGIAITASSGDGGFGAQYPAASPFVTAVGGTTLRRASTTARGWTESAWTCSGALACFFFGGAGSGCSVDESKPAWQSDSGCKKRTVADVSADADPSTGVAVYYNGGWRVYGGTSVASPIIASVYALAGNTSTITYGSYPYSHSGSLNDVTTSDANVSCSPAYLCNAESGFDGPTGIGTPNGTGGF